MLGVAVYRTGWAPAGAAVVETTQQHGTARWPSLVVDGGENHEAGVAWAGRRPRVEPRAKLHDRIGVDIADVEPGLLDALHRAHEAPPAHGMPPAPGGMPGGMPGAMPGIIAPPVGIPGGSAPGMALPGGIAPPPMIGISGGMASDPDLRLN